VNILGNSHAAAFRDGLPLLDEPDQRAFTVFGVNAQIEKGRFFEPHPQGILVTDPKMAGRLIARSGHPVITADASWAFILGHPGFLFNAWRDHRTVSVPGELQPVSKAALTAAITGQFKHVLEFFDALGTAKLRFVLILPPPPRRNKTRSPQQILTVDEAARRVLSNRAVRSGGALLEPPQGTVDGAGFLKPEFCAGPRPDGKEDPHHANAEYGRLMLEKLLPLVRHA